jgi:hypothetical protein
MALTYHIQRCGSPAGGKAFQTGNNLIDKTRKFFLSAPSRMLDGCFMIELFDNKLLQLGLPTPLA